MRFPSEVHAAPAEAGVYVLQNSDGTTTHVWYTENLQNELARIRDLVADPRKGATEFTYELIPDRQAREGRALELIRTLKATTQQP
jgi:hypothetical protein